MKTVHRASVPNLQRAASAAARRIEEISAQLNAEIIAKSVPASKEDKGSLWGKKNATEKPKTVTYSTKAIEKIIWNLVELELELKWWSTPVDERGKLSKPFSLR
jgi:hypothetical protein